MEGRSKAWVKNISRAMLISMVVDCVHLSQWPLHLVWKEVTTGVIPFLRVFFLLAVLVKPLIPIIPNILLLWHTIRHLLSLILLFKTRRLRISPLRVFLLLHLLLSLSFGLSSHSFFLNPSQLLNLSLLFVVVLSCLRCVTLRLWCLIVTTFRVVRRHHILLLLLHITLATLLLWLLLLLQDVPVLNLRMLLLTHHAACILILTIIREWVWLLHWWLGRCWRSRDGCLASHLCSVFWLFYYWFGHRGYLSHLISQILCLVHLGIRFIDSIL